MPPHLHALREGAGEVTPFRIDMVVVVACEGTGKRVRGLEGASVQ